MKLLKASIIGLFGLLVTTGFIHYVLDPPDGLRVILCILCGILVGLYWSTKVLEVLR